MILSLTELELKKCIMIILVIAVLVHCGVVITTDDNAQRNMPVFCGVSMEMVTAKLRP